MNVLLIGGGGREHALAWKLAQSKGMDRSEIWCGSENPGICEYSQYIDTFAWTEAMAVDFCRSKNIGLVVIGPEQPLKDGLTDVLISNGISVFGPTKAAAQLETSKLFAKQLCSKIGIPTAEYESFTDAESALEYVRNRGAPIVVKVDGLAAGKGVVVAQSVAEAEAAIMDIFFEEAVFDKVVIEECLFGEEISYFALCDGQTALPLISAQDYKRAGDGNTGPNTGGMGAFCPSPHLTPELEQEVLDEIIRPTIREMADRGTPFQGVLYAGLMLTDSGIKLIEFNTRFGDPECQVMMMLLKSDLLELLTATAEGRLDAVEKPEWHEGSALTVVMASNGYPGDYMPGSVIEGVDTAGGLDRMVFHAGTRMRGDMLVSYGGRVLNLTARGDSLSEARETAYAMVDAIDWEDGFCRRDIGGYYQAILPLPVSLP